MTDALAAEWLKTRTSRSTQVVLGVVVVFVGLMALLAFYFVATWDSLPPERRANSSLGSLPELMGWILALCMAVFGMLQVTSEYSSGMIRLTFVAMPRRRTVLAAKALIVTGATFVVAEAALWTTMLATAFIVGGRSINGQAPPDAGAVVLLVAMGLSTSMFALVGLALGAMARSALASVVALVMLWYIVPLLANHAPAPWSQVLTSLVPGALAGQLAGASNQNTVFGAALPPLAALGAMLAYALIPLALAMIVVTRRDA